MYKKWSMAVIGVILAMAFPGAAYSETVMEKVARTQVLTVGTRTDLIPYAYINEKQELVGYSIDILKLIQAQLSQELNKEIVIQVVKVDVNNRIPKIISGEVDIVCEDANFTWERDRVIDFSVSYAVSGIKLLVKTGSNLDSPESLAGKRIGVIPNTTPAQAIKLIQPQAILVPLQNPQATFADLNGGKLDAVAGDFIVLEGVRQIQQNPEAYEIVPEKPYARYGVACMVPENNSTFLNLVNFSIVKLMQGYVVNDPQSVEMINRWFGAEGLVPIAPDVVRDFFKSIIITKEQIPLDRSQERSQKSEVE